MENLFLATVDNAIEQVVLMSFQNLIAMLNCFPVQSDVPIWKSTIK
jgi:hypothetical protein